MMLRSTIQKFTKHCILTLSWNHTRSREETFGMTKMLDTKFYRWIPTQQYNLNVFDSVICKISIYSIINHLQIKLKLRSIICSNNKSKTKRNLIKVLKRMILCNLSTCFLQSRHLWLMASMVTWHRMSIFLMLEPQSRSLING